MIPSECQEHNMMAVLPALSKNVHFRYESKFHEVAYALLNLKW